MSDTPQGPGWWQASDGKWYPPEQAATPPPTPAPPAAPTPVGPPPQPAYQAPSAAPPTPGSAQQEPAAPGAAFNYGWLKFQQNIGEIIIISIVSFLALVIITVIGWLILAATVLAAGDSVDCTTNAAGRVVCDGGDAGAGGFAVFLGFIALWILFMFVLFMVQMAFIRGGLLITYGEKLEVKKMLSTEGIGQYILASVIISIAVLIGSWLCVIPGLIVLFFSQFFGYFILDKKMSALDGIKASFTLVNKNLGSLIAFFIGCYIAYFIGAILCGIGLIVAVPVVVIATAYMYRRLQGEPVAV